MPLAVKEQFLTIIRNIFKNNNSVKHYKKLDFAVPTFGTHEWMAGKCSTGTLPDEDALLLLLASLNNNNNLDLSWQYVTRIKRNYCNGAKNVPKMEKFTESRPVSYIKDC